MLIELAGEVGAAAADKFTCAVTMTAELSQMFRTKREGVGFVLDAVSAAFPNADIRVFTTGGQFLSVDEAARSRLRWQPPTGLPRRPCRAALQNRAAD